MFTPGACTSPNLANLISNNLDKEFQLMQKNLNGFIQDMLMILSFQLKKKLKIHKV